MNQLFKRAKNKWRTGGLRGVVYSVVLNVRIILREIYKSIYWNSAKILSLLGMKYLKRFITGNDSWMYLDPLDRGISLDLFRQGIREPMPTELFKEQLRPGMTVVDIGANIGYYALMEARKVGPTGQIFAVEPVPANFELLNKNIQLNQYSWVKCYNLAISGGKTSVNMNYMDKSNLSHVVDLEVTDQEEWNVDISVKRTFEIPAKSLDSFVSGHQIAKIGAIRMDVEGYEIEIIKGAKQTLSDPNNAGLLLFLELHPRIHGMQPGNPTECMLRDLLNYGFSPLFLCDAVKTYSELDAEDFVVRASRELTASHVFLRKK